MSTYPPQRFLPPSRYSSPYRQPKPHSPLYVSSDCEPLEFLEVVVRSKDQPVSKRIEAAKIALPYRHWEIDELMATGLTYDHARAVNGLKARSR
jgi:hypothetical protein